MSWGGGILKFITGSSRPYFIPLTKGSTLDPSYDIFACFKFSLLFLVFLHVLYVPVAFSELLPMNKGEFKIQTEATYTFPD